VDVPAEALVFRAGRPFVPVVSSTNRVTLRPVTVGHFDGALAGIGSGLASGELVALHLGRSVRDGDAVEPVPAALGSGSTHAAGWLGQPRLRGP
jgi:hypothetical protein